MILELDLDTIDGYRTFLAVKALPVYRFTGREAWFPDEYADRVGAGISSFPIAYTPRPGLFDYQRDIASLAVRRRKFAVFADCGLGKTLIFLEYARHVLGELPRDRAALIVSPSMVVPQTIAEAAKFYGDSLTVDRVFAKNLAGWLTSGTGRLGITNYEAISDRVTDPGRLGCLILDESSLLKSHYGRWGSRLIELGRGLDWKLCLTGTPAPNDRIEYANHAVFLDQYPTVNSFLAKFFVNRGETANRWELKPHALRPFYRALSHWCIFLSDPAVYGWKDNSAPLPPINTHVIDVPLTDQQKEEARLSGGGLFGGGQPGGIGDRSKLARIAKGFGRNGKPIPSHKPGVVCDLARAGQSIVWCRYNAEQDDIARRMPDAANVDGSTAEDDRLDRIAAFQSGRSKQLITKPKILGFGLNLQCARRQVFSTIQDSYEEYYQAVKRSNRTGSTATLDVFLPVTELEYPMLETVLRKADRVAADTREQERLFREVDCVGL